MKPFPFRNWLVLALLVSGQPLAAASTYVYPFAEVQKAHASIIMYGELSFPLVNVEGKGYTRTPHVTPVLRYGSGSGMVAHAVLSGNSVSEVLIDDPGTYSYGAIVDLVIDAPDNLIESVLDNPASNQVDTIEMPAGRFELNTTIRRDVTLRGQGADFSVFSGSGAGPVFTVLPGVRAGFMDLAMTNGVAPSGGGIYNGGGVVEATRCRIAYNRATAVRSGGGGGIYNGSTGQVFLADCEIRNNSAAWGGAGIRNSGVGSTVLPGSATNASLCLAAFYTALANTNAFQVSCDIWGEWTSPQLESYFSYDYTLMLSDLWNQVKYLADVADKFLDILADADDPIYPWDIPDVIDDFRPSFPEMPPAQHHTITFDDVKFHMESMQLEVDLAYFTGAFALELANAPQSIRMLPGPFAVGELSVSNSGWRNWRAPVLSLSNCVVAGNVVDGLNGFGAGIHNDLGLLFITRSDVSSNVVSARVSAFGAGLANVAGAVHITDSTLAGNKTETTTVLAAGGAVYSAAGWLEVSNSTMAANVVTSTNAARVARGGAVDNGIQGEAMIRQCNLSQNQAAQGGGLANDWQGNLLVENCTFKTNRVVSDYSAAGGGIWNQCGTVTVSNSTFTGNVASGNAQGGALGNFSQPKLANLNPKSEMLVVNCTLSTNQVVQGILNIPDPVALEGCLFNWLFHIFGSDIAGPCDATTVPRIPMALKGQGGAIFTGSENGGLSMLTLESSTLAGNQALGSNGAGGGVYSSDLAGALGSGWGTNQLVIANSLLAGNAQGDFGQYCYSSLNRAGTAGFNLDGDGTLLAAKNGSGTILTTTNAAMGPLADNGGPTPTHALLQTSPARNQAINTTHYPATDQRGIPRPTTNRDVGAFQSTLPQVAADSYQLREDGCLTVSAADGVLGNDFENGGAVMLVTNVANGSLTLAADGGFTYCSIPGYSGPDGFWYVLVDSWGRTSAPMNVTLAALPILKVTALNPATNNPAIARNANFTVTFDGPIQLPSAPAGVLLRGSQGSVYSASSATNGNLLILSPTAVFHAGEQVTLSLLEPLRGVGGGTCPVTQWQFYAGASGGEGVFRPGQDLGSKSTVKVAMGDLNGDGALDLYLAGQIQDEVWINSGHGNFTLGQVLHGNSTGVALGDLNGDGTADAVVTKGGGFLMDPGYTPEYNRVLFNDGHGHFTESAQHISTGVYYDDRVQPGVALGQGSTAVALADLNGDGSLDIFLVNGMTILNGNQTPTTGNTVWLNNGRGCFTRTGQTLGNDFGAAVALGDLNGDGYLDALVGNHVYQSAANQYAGSVYQVYLNDGTGRFAAGQRDNTVATAGGVALADVNHDGRLDAVTAFEQITNVPYSGSYSYAQRVWTNDGAGTFTASQTIATHGSRDVALGDFNADGALDILCVGFNEVWLNNGSGQFTKGAKMSTDHCESATVGDVDGDGDLDLVLLSGTWLWSDSKSDHVVVWRNNSTTAAPDLYLFLDEDTTGFGEVLFDTTDADGDPLTAQVATASVEYRGTLGYLYSHHCDASTIHFEGTYPDGQYVGIQYVPQTPTNGTLFLFADGSYIYAPTANFSGVDSFKYVVWDGQNGATGTVSLVVLPVNDPPVALPDYYDLAPGRTLNVTAGQGVLTNDYDVDNAVLTVTVEHSTAHGTLALSADGSFSYQPLPGYYGSDYFTYRVSDGSASAVAQARLGNIAPTARPDLYSLPANGVLPVPAAAGVLANDIDADGDSLSARLSTGPVHGTLSLNADGSFNYLRQTNYSGNDSFYYLAHDGRAPSQPVRVRLGNAAPLATNDSGYVTYAGKALTVSAAPGVLVNDRDPDGDALTAVLEAGPSHGTLNLGADGSFTYTPATNYWGSDSFTYRANDGGTSGNVAMVSLVVQQLFTVVAVQPSLNAVNVATNTTIQMTFNIPIAASNILGRVRVYGSLSGRHDWTADITNQTATLRFAGAFYPGDLVTTVFTDSGAPNFRDGYAWQFTVQALGGIAAFTATSALSTNRNSRAVKSADFNEDGLPDAVATSDNELMLYLNQTNGSFASRILYSGYVGGYACVGDFNGDGHADIQFMNYLLLGNGHGNFTTNSVPTGMSLGRVNVPGDFDRNGTLDVITASYDGTFQVWTNSGTGSFAVEMTTNTGLSISGVAVGDVDGDGDLDLLTVDYATNGRALLWLNDGTGHFTLSPQSFGSDTFGYDYATMADMDGDGDLDLLIGSQMPQQGIRLWINDGQGHFTLRYPALRSKRSVLEIAVGDLNADGYLDIVEAGQASSPTWPGTNTVWLNDGTGNFSTNSYTLPYGDARAVALADLDGDGDLDIFFANGSRMNLPDQVWWNQNPPRARDDYYAYAGGTLVVTATNGVLQNDRAGDGGAMFAIPGTAPTNGTLTFLTNGAFTFVPGSGFNGAAVFTYQAADSHNTSSVARVKIGNTAPLLDAATNYTALNHQSLRVTAAAGVLASDTDPDGDVLRVLLVAGPAHGTLVLNPDGSFTYVPQPGYIGSDSFSYQVTDGLITSAVMVVTLDVKDQLLVQATSPVINALWAADNPDILATFDHPLNPDSVSGNVSLAGSLSGRITPLFRVAGGTLIINPSTRFRPGEEVTVSLSPGLRGTGNEPMGAGYVWQFRVRAPASSGVLTNSGQGLSVPPAKNNCSAALADLNGDGSLDAVLGPVPVWIYTNGTLVTVPGSDATTVWTNSGAGQLQDAGQRLGTNDSSTFSIAFGDLDGDGSTDMILGRPFCVDVWMNNGHGVFTRRASTVITNAPGSGLRLADLDGDGSPELVIAGSGLSTWHNTGSGDFTNLQTLATRSFRSVSLADMNQDGALDLVAGESYAVSVWLNDGHGRFTSGQVFDWEVAIMSTAVGDLNGDGLPDVLVMPFYTNAQVWLNSSGGLTNTGQWLGTNSNDSATLMDMNGDGSLDALIMQDYFLSGTNYNCSRLWLNDGTGHFTGGILLGNTNMQYRAAAVGDLNGDGAPDAVLAEYGPGNTLVYFNSTGMRPVDGSSTWNITDEGVALPFTNVAFFASASANVSVTVRQDTAAKGRLTAESMLATGFTGPAGGPYTRPASPAGSAETAVRQLVFAPTANRLPVGQSETNTLSVVASDGVVIRTNSQFIVTVLSVNNPPNALPDSGAGYQTVKDAVFTTANVLTNDSDPDVSDQVHLLSVDASQTIGLVTSLTNGTFRYDPAIGFASLPLGTTVTDSFSYCVIDNGGLISTANVAVAIAGKNIAPIALPDTIAIGEHSGAVQLAALMLTNDVDPDAGETRTLGIHSINASSTKGTVQRLTNDVVIYNPAGVFGNLPGGVSTNDTFSYSVQDVNGATSTMAQVTMIILGTNDAPVPAADTLALKANCAPTNLTAALLANDTDPDPGDTGHLTITGYEVQLLYGTLSLTSGALVYSPGAAVQFLPAGVWTTNSFNYRVQDPSGAETTTAVTLAIEGVNDAPAAATDEVVLQRDTGQTNLTSLLLQNDSDPDTNETQTLTITGVNTNGITGAVRYTNGMVLYTPVVASNLGLGQQIDDHFLYTIQDTHGISSTGAVNLTIEGRNDPPVAGQDTVYIANNAGYRDITTNLLANDMDPNPLDASQLRISGILTNGIKGSLILSNGLVWYSPAGRFTNLALAAKADDGFVYYVRDPAGAEDMATVKITVLGTVQPATIKGLTRLSNDVVKLNFQGQAGMDYSVLYSTNLINWMPLGVAVSGPAGQFMLMVTNKPAPSAVFFRLAGQVSSMPVVTAFSHVLDTTYIGFGGKTGHSYSVLSSTNLVDWSDEGVATEFEPGIFAYLFKGDTNHPTRFYRLRSP